MAETPYDLQYRQVCLKLWKLEAAYPDLQSESRKSLKKMMELYGDEAKEARKRFTEQQAVVNSIFNLRQEQIRLYAKVSRRAIQESQEFKEKHICRLFGYFHFWLLTNLC